jgi:hypothetical protein
MEMPLDFICAMAILEFMARKTPIDAMIEEKKAEIDAMRRALDIMSIELRTLEEARRAVTGEAPPVRVLTADIDERVDHKRRGRSLSDAWKRVLTSIAEKGDGGADLDEIFGLCAEHGIQLQRPTLRAQMSTYVKRGYLGRTGGGKFFIALGGVKLLKPNSEVKFSVINA